jgi:N-acetyl-anhydromuramyl-L-alanine amidase AmpD
VQQKQEAQRQNREMEDLLKQLKQYGYEQGIGTTEEP